MSDISDELFGRLSPKSQRIFRQLIDAREEHDGAVRAFHEKVAHLNLVGGYAFAQDNVPDMDTLEEMGSFAKKALWPLQKTAMQRQSAYVRRLEQFPELPQEARTAFEADYQRFVANGD
ncbi:MAG: hypothetical protein ABIA93_00970 [Candidatus Woesearchaeota archaeon]